MPTRIVPLTVTEVALCITMTVRLVDTRFSKGYGCSFGYGYGESLPVVRYQFWLDQLRWWSSLFGRWEHSLR
jgi:hypothetical protein